MAPQVLLEHNGGCTAKAAREARKDLVPEETLEKECEEDIRRWTVTGLRKFEMFHVLSDRFAPLKLGEPGRQKVSKACALLLVVNRAVRCVGICKYNPPPSTELAAVAMSARSTMHNNPSRAQ